MKTSIAKYSKSFFVKILVGIIILPFVFWGMGDVFRGGNQNIVATIDSEKITTQEIVNYLNRLNLSEEERKNISKNNLLERILSEYIGRKVITLEVDRMNINISDASLRNIIINDKTFHKDGKFSRTAYEKFLLTSSLTAPAFEQNIVEQEKRRQLLSFLSKGYLIPSFLVEKEFRKENQIKNINYLDLNSYYKNKTPEKKDVEKIFNENKDIFFETFKSLSYVTLSPQKLIGQEDYNEAFFKKIDDLENEILDGKSLIDVSRDYNLDLVKTNILNQKQINKNGVKEKIDKELFAKIFSMNLTNSPELLKVKEKYYIAEVSTIDKISKKLEDASVQKLIKDQIKIRDKIENNTKIAKEISLGAFNLEKMKEFADKNNLDIKNAEIKGLADNTIFSKGIIERIFLAEDKKISLITNSTLSSNYIIYVNKTNYRKLEKDSENYDKYLSKAKLNLSQKTYELYDQSVNAKYNIELNQKVIDRIKNSF